MATKRKMKKYELTNETKVVWGHTLHRIKAIVDFAFVEKDDVGGWIEAENNLAQDGDAWVYGNACVYGDAWVSGKARVSDNARVYGKAEVYGDAWVSGNALVSGNARVFCNADYMVFKNSWSSGRWLTYTRSNKMWSVGCFYGTGKTLIKKAYADSEKNGKCYEAIVRAVEEIEMAMSDKGVAK